MGAASQVLRKTLGEIILKNGHPALRLYGEHDEQVHRGEGYQEVSCETILKNGQRALNLYSDRTHLYFQPSGKFIMVVLGEMSA